MSNMFESRKAMRLFAELSEAANSEQRRNLTKRVVARFEEKMMSEDGEFSTFKITESDVKEIAAELKI